MQSILQLWIERIITDDEKLNVYNNVHRKRSWSKHDDAAQTKSKAELHQEKIMPSIWWDYKDVVYFEPFPNNRTINSDVYCQQLVKLEEAIKERRAELANRKGIVFHHDNARPHTSFVIRTQLLEIGWKVMSHPPYSPDLAPSDYHLFWRLQNFLNGKNFSNEDDLKSQLAEFFAVKDQKFYQRDPKVTRKMAKGLRTEWKIFDWLKLIFCVEKNWVLFHTKKSKLLSCQPIVTQLWSKRN